MTERERLIGIVDNYEFDSTRCNLCDRPDSDCAKCGSESFADYLLDNGVIAPPCKVGDKVYSVIYDTVTNERYIGTAETIAETGRKGFFLCTDGFYEYPYESIGKDVFLSREEAEKALKER